MNSVKITIDREILINGERAGFIAGTTREVWIHGYDADGKQQFVARMKYSRPRAKARAFIKSVFSRVTMPEYLALLEQHGSPLAVADAIGATFF